jgi:hypothetical protein
VTMVGPTRDSLYAAHMYYKSITEVVDTFSLWRIVGYIKSAERFNNYLEDDDIAI